MIGHDEARELLQTALGKPEAEFRAGQWEAIEALVNRREKLLLVQRTGWGKSAVYFIATRILRDQGAGPTLIVSPLLALMRNQIEGAERLQVKAVTIHSDNKQEWPNAIWALRDGKADALLISPERLGNDGFVQDVLLPMAERVGLLVVDEAHCISDWGHDFRPDYQRLRDVLRRMPATVPVLGTTATANNRVIDDVVMQLGDIKVQRGPLMRETLALQTLNLPDQASRLAWLVEYLPTLPGTGIVYTLTKRDTEQVAEWLNGHGIAAQAYHSRIGGGDEAGDGISREQLEAMLLGNELKALVATMALGMGYDKPDLGFVVHYQAPGSIVAYYQQVGRAGRAVDHAVGVLMAGLEDEDIHEYFRRQAFPDEKHVAAILGALERSDSGLTVEELEAEVNLRVDQQLKKALKFLAVGTPAPIIKDRTHWRRTAVPYAIDHEHIQRLTQQRESEWHEVQEYVATGDCLMSFLARALDDPDPRPCGRCANCMGKAVVGESIPQGLVLEAARFVKQAESPLDCHKQAIAGSFTIYPFTGRLPANLRAETGRILSRWGDAGWGRTVTDGKHAGHFSDELVKAVAEMIQQRWHPAPPPTWVTCVPSLRCPNLVSDFAQRLAERLKLPFRPVVRKVRENIAQKLQENRFHQCRNLDGAFAIEGPLDAGPVLLVDDIVDSRWTLTVVTALLRMAGSGPVFPVALATAGSEE